MIRLEVKNITFLLAAYPYYDCLSHRLLFVTCYYHSCSCTLLLLVYNMYIFDSRGYHIILCCCYHDLRSPRLPASSCKVAVAYVITYCVSTYNII